jgi:hypothetical protein
VKNARFSADSLKIPLEVKYFFFLPFPTEIKMQTGKHPAPGENRADAAPKL